MSTQSHPFTIFSVRSLPQFSLGTLLCWTLLVSLLAVALASASQMWAQVALTLVLLLGSITLLVAIYCQAETRARAIGRLIFGVTFFLWSVTHLDRIFNANTGAPQFGAVTESLNEATYSTVCRLRGAQGSNWSSYPAGMTTYTTPMLSPSAIYPAVSYRLAETSPDEVPEAISLPSASPAEPYGSLPPAAFPSSSQYASPAPYGTAPNFIPGPTGLPAAIPVMAYIPYHEFHTIANCFWALACGAFGGWIATVIYRRSKEQQAASDAINN